MVEPLLEGDPVSAEAALIRYMTRLGKMHADTVGKAADYQALLRAANPALTDAPVTQNELPLGIRHFAEILTGFGLPVAPGLLAELPGMYERVEQPGAFSAFVHHDLCPDNMFFIGEDVRLFDFEGGCFGHALIDASYARIPFPSCWCCNRIPQTVVVKVEAAYRAELI
ncbi:MAG TPA: phosphotransferase, partial [Caldilineaceae bacterium]|nr:phosphotransferase [Caldilineaceae bacterium]